MTSKRGDQIAPGDSNVMLGLPHLRQSVQKARNRGEAYHRMRRAISYVNSGRFRVKTEAEQQIWNE
jgi:TnpA family transposase